MTPWWQRVPSWARWPLGYLVVVGIAALVGWLSIGVGNAMFIVGAIVILASVGFVGIGSDTRFRVIRNFFGIPITLEKQDPLKRQREISTGMKVFLMGLAIWAPLLYIALRA